MLGIIRDLDRALAPFEGCGPVTFAIVVLAVAFYFALTCWG